MIPSTTTNTSQVSQATGTGSPIVLSLNPAPSAGTIRPPSVRILAGRLRSAPYTHSFPIVLDSTDPWVVSPHRLCSWSRHEPFGCQSDSEILDNDHVVLHEPQGEQDPVVSSRPLTCYHENLQRESIEQRGPCTKRVPPSGFGAHLGTPLLCFNHCQIFLTTTYSVPPHASDASLISASQGYLARRSLSVYNRFITAFDPSLADV